jgi:hypothetical protein
MNPEGTGQRGTEPRAEIAAITGQKLPEAPARPPFRKDFRHIPGMARDSHEGQRLIAFSQTIGT